MLFQAEHYGCSSQLSLSEVALDLPIKIDEEMYFMVDAPELCQKQTG